jgi:hypothetical protein
VLPLREDAARRANLGRRTTLGAATLEPHLRPLPPPSRRSKTSSSPHSSLPSRRLRRITLRLAGAGNAGLAAAAGAVRPRRSFHRPNLGRN